MDDGTCDFCNDFGFIPKNKNNIDTTLPVLKKKETAIIKEEESDFDIKTWLDEIE